MEIPPCPLDGHEKSVVVRAGWYGRKGQRRQRWKCTVAGRQPHRFAEVLPRIVTGSLDPVCPDCATALEPWEGQPAPRLYGFTARDVAAALASVAAGSSYRQAAETIRIRAGRPLSTTPTRTPAKPNPEKGKATKGKAARKGKVVAPANRHPQLVSDWVEVFAPIIWSAYAPTSWPAAVAVDEIEFRHGRRGKPRGDKAFSVLAVVGYDAETRPYVAAIEAVAHANLQAWTTLLTSLQGRPGWVVGDGGHPLKAAATAWSGTDDPDDDEMAVNLGDDLATRFWRCEWHLARNISDPLPPQVTRDRTDSIHHLITEAVRSADGWQRLCDELTARSQHDDSYRGALQALLNIRRVVQAQDGAHVHGPRSTGAVEEFFRQLDNTIADRASRLTNKTRTDALLKLIASRRNGWLDENRWAELIREHLTHTKGRAPHQRRHVDPHSSPSLR